jgi:hypothetical protein
VSNTRAIVEALLGIRSGFVRTPKRGEAKTRGYRLPVDLTFAFEALLAAYCLVGFCLYVRQGRLIVGPFLLLFVLAFGSMAAMTLREAIRRWRAPAGPKERKQDAADGRRLRRSPVGEKR